MVDARSALKEMTFQGLIDAGLIEIGDGYRAKNNELGGTGPLFLRAGHVSDTHISFDGVERFRAELADAVASKMSKPGDVVITTKGNSTGRTTFVTPDLPPFVYSPHLSYWRSIDQRAIVPGFLRAWSNGAEFTEQLEGMKLSTDMAPYLSLTDQRRLRITLPPPCEQGAIARVLGGLDDKIELNRRMNRTLEDLARGLFRSWFVDFDPVTRNGSAKAPAENNGLFPKRLIDSPLGPIPEGWRVSKIGEHMVNFDSKRVPVAGGDRVKRQGKYPYYGAASVMDYVDDYLFDGIYLLVGEDGSVVQPNGLAVTQYVWGKIWVNNHAHVLQGKGGVCTEHLWAYFQYEDVGGIVTGAVQPKITQGNMNGLPFLYPGEAVCREFAQFVAPWFARVRANTEESRDLAALRDALLPQLLSGEIRLREAQRAADNSLQSGVNLGSNSETVSVSVR